MATGTTQADFAAFDAPIGAIDLPFWHGVEQDLPENAPKLCEPEPSPGPCGDPEHASGEDDSVAPRDDIQSRVLIVPQLYAGERIQEIGLQLLNLRKARAETLVTQGEVRDRARRRRAFEDRQAARRYLREGISGGRWQAMKARNPEWRKRLEAAAERGAATLAADMVPTFWPGEWHRKRARSLGVPLNFRMAHGAANKLSLMHQETGELKAVCTCKQPLCPDCEAGRVARVRKRLLAVVESHDRIERERKDGGRKVGMLTFTVRHSGSPDVDATRIREAFPRFRAWLHRTVGALTYLRTEECTPGTQKGGHTHWHLVAWLPDFFDYAAMHRAWWRALGWDATDGPCAARDDGTGRATCTADVPCSRHAPGNVDVARRPDDASTAATLYASKAAQASGALGYAAKAASFDTFDAASLARYLDGRYGRRWFQCSRGFWDVAPKPEPEWRPAGEAWPARVSTPPDDWWTAKAEKPGSGVESGLSAVTSSASPSRRRGPVGSPSLAGTAARASPSESGP